MAQKRITIELTEVEAQHVTHVLEQANLSHHKEHGRNNQALDRALKKIERATSKEDEGDQQGDQPVAE